MLHYDGIINTRNGSDGGATAWQDLSGNRKMAMCLKEIQVIWK